MGQFQSPVHGQFQALKPSVRKLQKEQVLHAIAHGGEDHLILLELTRLINSYLEECSRLGGGGLEGLRKKIPTCPIEEIALRLATAAEQAKIQMY